MHWAGQRVHLSRVVAVGCSTISGCVPCGIRPLFLSSCAVAPPAPTGVRVSAVTSTSLTLRWDIPHEPSLVEMYVIELRRELGQWREGTTRPGGTYNATLDQLVPNTQYQVRVVAQNQAGRQASLGVEASTVHQGE